MELVKPEPLIIGGKAHYTLTSYDPVSVTLVVPRITDFDIEIGVGELVAQAGGTPSQLEDPAWLQENLGVSDARELRAALREEMESYNAQMMDQQKAMLCVAELAKRLMQRVPDSAVEATRRAARAEFSAQLAEEGMSETDIFAQFGDRAGQIEAMFDERAKEMAEQDAALEAWIENRRLQITEDEMGGLLGVPPEEAKSFFDELRAAGQWEAAHEAALRAKAMNIIAAECTCAYHHETEEEAAQRQLAQMAQMGMMGQARPSGSDTDTGSTSSASHPHLKLV